MSEEFKNPVSTGEDFERVENLRTYTQVLSAFINDPSSLSDFSTHLVDAVQTKLGWADETVNPTTFEDMGDDQLLAHLAEFLGSGQINVSINGGAIEIPQLIMDISHMSDEELAEMDIADPRVIAAKLRKATMEAAQDAADRAHEREMEEHKKWLEETHAFGRLSYTGAEWQKLNEWATDKDNQDDFIKYLAESEGISIEEAKAKGTKAFRAIELMNKEKRTTAEEAELKELQKNKEVEQTIQKAKTLQENGRVFAVQGADNTRVTAESKTSVEEGKNDFADDVGQTVSVNRPAFISSAPSEIKTEASPTSEFNAKAANVIELEKQKPVAKAEIASTMTVINTSSIGFG